MAQIKTRTLLGSSNIAADRITINRIFEILETLLNDLQNYVDIDAKELKGISSLSLYKGDSVTSFPNDFLIRTNGSINALGNIVLGGNIQSGIGTFSNGIRLLGGNLDILGSASQINLGGNLNLGGELVLQDFGLQGTVTAYSKAYFQSISPALGQTLVIQDSLGTDIGGKVSMNGRNALILDWSGYNSAVLGSDLNHVMLMTEPVTSTNNSLKPGQVVEIMVQIPSLETPEFYILGETLRHPSYESFNVKFTANYQSIRVIYDGSNWVILSMLGAVIEEV